MNIKTYNRAIHEWINLSFPFNLMFYKYDECDLGILADDNFLKYMIPTKSIEGGKNKNSYMRYNLILTLFFYTYTLNY